MLALLKYRIPRLSLTPTSYNRRNLFINVETTPNPTSLKFCVAPGSGITVLPENFGTGLFFEKSRKQSINSPLVKELLKIPGVKSVFLGRDFVTVTKDSDTEPWASLKPVIFTSLLDFFAEPLPGSEHVRRQVISEDSVSATSDTTILESDTDVVAAIKELMETRVRPSVQEDGGDIFFVGFDEATGIVKVRLAGSCVGCPSSSVTLRNGVENMLMHYIPEVKGIQDVSGTSEGGDAETDQPQKLQFSPEFSIPN